LAHCAAIILSRQDQNPISFAIGHRFAAVGRPWMFVDDFRRSSMDVGWII